MPAMRNSNYLNFYVWDKHLVINTHHKTYFHLLLKRYYCVDERFLLRARLPRPVKQARSHGRGRCASLTRFQSAVPEQLRVNKASRGDF